MNVIRLGARTIGDGAPVFVIAEAGVNHNGSLEMAQRLVDAARDAGADAVKFQTFKAEQVVTAAAPKAAYQVKATGGHESQLEMIRGFELSFEAFRILAGHCRERGIMFLSTPFDAESADFLDDIGVPGFKIASGEITNLPFLSHVAAKGKPVIVSTGMATLAEVALAVRCFEASGNRELALLHCVSNYPAAAADANLRAMTTLAATFHVPVGYSDHTLGLEVALAAVAVGARIVEKHFTLDRSLPGPDHRASLTPDELKALMRGIRNVEASLGDGVKEPRPSELPIADVARRSLVAACDIRCGTTITAKALATLRPGTGLPPTMWDAVVGRTARVDIPAGAILSLEMLA